MAAPPHDVSAAAPASAIPFGEAVRVWMRVALQSFGGPAGQIAVMHRILVGEKRWVDEARFLHALNYCMLLPGPEAQQLATYLGWLLHGHRGGLVAGVLFVLPGFISILALSFLYVLYGDVTWVEGLFFGLQAAVLAIVVQALLRIGGSVLTNPLLVTVAAAAFVGIFFLELPFPLIVLSALLVGLAGGRIAPALFVAGGHGGASATAGAAEQRHARSAPARGRMSALRRSAVIAGLGGALWFGPIALLALFLGADSVLVHEGLFFSKAAVVTFGGAYAVLSYIAQAAVETYGWLEPGEMLVGLGFAESTPGPLIQVVQHVGFLGAFRAPGPFAPLVAGLLGALVTTWVTFVPCFIWIFLGAPYVEALRGNRQLSAALSAVTAAVVGVIANLALWFGIHVLFTEVGELRGFGARVLVPDARSLDPFALLIAALAFLALFRLRLGVLATLGGCAALGVALRVLFA